MHFGRQPKPVKSFLIIASAVACLCETGAANLDLSKLPPAANRKVDFEKEVLPIFKESCAQCHSDKKQEGGLRLDVRSAALRGGESGPVIIPNKSSESLLVRAVAGLGEDITKMPKKGDPLTAEQIGVIRAWIDQGAVWPAGVTAGAKDPADHWAFKAPVRPPLPEVKNTGWVRAPIDAFVLARLEKEGLQPSPQADKITLLRRLSLDLVGLPPKPEEIDSFLADSSPDAYEKQVERLLKSPHYGEKWGRHWLDAARYCDSDGFEKDKPRFVWHYRDWVVNALNRDLSYDRFVIEQMAGDEFYNPSQEQLVATGFLRNSMLNEEGGVDPEQFRMDAMFDRMDAIGKSVLGLTIQCAQCHSHKFDPITQEDYYKMFSFLNNDHEASMVAYTPSEQQERSDLLRQMRDLEEGLRHTTSDWEERMNKWEDSARNNQPEWSAVRCQYEGENGERFYYYEDGSIRAASYAPTQWTAHFKGTNNLPFIGAFQLEQLTDPNLPCNGPGRSVQKGMSALSEFSVDAQDASNPTSKVKVKFVKATADFSNPEKDLEPEFDNRSGKKRVYGPVEYAIDGKDDTAWGIDAGPGLRNQARKAVFLPEKPITFTNGVILTFSLKQNHGGWNSDDNQNNNLGRFRMSVTSATNVIADPVPANVREIFNIPHEKRTPAQIAAVFSFWRTTAPEFKETNDKITALWKQWPEGAPTSILLARKGQGPNEERRPTHMFKRGDWLKPGKEVKSGVPAFLNPLPPNADDSRLTFAKWMVDKKSPTTARVCVNRIWQSYFGTGLVDTPEDFGLRAPDPTHPALLDWLALEFMEPTVTDSSSKTAPDWSMKHIHRLIVNSATYKQSSKITPELYEKDQFNKLLARGPRFRVEAEIVRDIALSASGLLNPELGGPSVMPPAPAFLFQPPASYGPKTWNEDTGPNRYRRGIYTFRFRSVPYPMLQTFDAPNGDFSCVRRLRSNSPLQALTSLNEIVFVECAQALARHSLEHGANDEERISYAFRSCVGRKPEDEELKELTSLLTREKSHIAEGWINPHELATGKAELPKNLPKDTTPTQLAAYTVVSRVLLNLDETITKE
jgi:mono/diheme cytochrome c family protein